MSRKPMKATPLAVSLQTTSLVIVAGAVFGILISDVARHRTDVARVEAMSKAQLSALPGESEAKSGR
jgi:hypothetical protein